jgi:predicted translin family RNA/ssDNA-binding protein
MNPNSVIIEVKPPITNKIVIDEEFKKIVIDEEFKKNAIKLAKAFGNKDIESLQTDLPNFKQDIEKLQTDLPNFKDIEKLNNGQMEYSTMRSLYD